MRILVALSFAPDEFSDIKIIEGSSAELNWSDLEYVISSFDEIALSAALEYKKQNRAEIILFNVGRECEHSSILKCYALGVDKIVRVIADSYDVNFIAQAIYDYSKGNNITHIFCGKRSDCVSSGEIPFLISEKFDKPLSFNKVVENGVVCFDENAIGINKLPIPSFRQISEALKKDIENIVFYYKQEDFKPLIYKEKDSKSPCIFIKKDIDIFFKNIIKQNKIKIDNEFSPCYMNRILSNYKYKIDREDSLNKIALCGGNGLLPFENWDILNILGDKLSAKVYCTKPICDQGYLPYSFHIGSSGKKIGADIYITFGVSGALQHICGVSSDSLIIAINNDSSAPIFKYANYGIVSDAKSVIEIMCDIF